MKKIIVILGCVLLLFCACGKSDKQEAEQTVDTLQNSDAVVIEDVKAREDGELIAKMMKKPQNFSKEFKKLDGAQQYYFCAAFAMGAMSVAKPITATAMVNYFMGLGVAKYNVGINDETYKAFNAGKNTFRSEKLVNLILEKRICENIMNDAAEFAKKQNYHVRDLDKRGKREVEKVIRYIKQTNKE